jgi:hypothetical protein
MTSMLAWPTRIGPNRTSYVSFSPTANGCFGIGAGPTGAAAAAEGAGAADAVSTRVVVSARAGALAAAAATAPELAAGALPGCPPGGAVAVRGVAPRLPLAVAAVEARLGVGARRGTLAPGAEATGAPAGEPARSVVSPARRDATTPESSLPETPPLAVGRPREAPPRPQAPSVAMKAAATRTTARA